VASIARLAHGVGALIAGSHAALAIVIMIDVWHRHHFVVRVYRLLVAVDHLVVEAADAVELVHGVVVIYGDTVHGLALVVGRLRYALNGCLTSEADLVIAGMVESRQQLMALGVDNNWRLTLVALVGEARWRLHPFVLYRRVRFVLHPGHQSLPAWVVQDTVLEKIGIAGELLVIEIQL